MSDSLRPHGLQRLQGDPRLPCPSPTPGACSNPCSSSWWCHPTSITPFSCVQSFPTSGSFPMSPLFASGSQSIGASALASDLPMNIQDWFPLGLTGLIPLQSKGLSRVFSSTTVQKHQFFGVLDNMRHFTRAEISESYECHEVSLLKASASKYICEIKDK